MRQPGNCRSCDAPLARHSPAPLCVRCRQRARDAFVSPPEVPPEFWDSELLTEAFSAQHMGKVCRAYRSHPYHAALHGRHGIPQTTVAGWLSMTQAQVSRIENGPLIRNLDSLVYWAVTLRIPEARLWFDLPSRSRGEEAATRSGVAPVKPDPAVVVSSTSGD
jgi:hypothetical protein